MSSQSRSRNTSSSRRLSEREAAFVREYLLDGNGKQAAIRAGYSPRTAKAQGSRLLTRVDVRAEIAKAQEQKAERVQARVHASIDNVVDELAKIAFANMLDYIWIGDEGAAFVDLSRLTRDQAAAIVEVQIDELCNGRGKDARRVRRVKIKLADKRSALVDLGKHLGGFHNRVNLGVQKGNPLTELMKTITRSALQVRPGRGPINAAGRHFRRCEIGVRPRAAGL